MKLEYVHLLDAQREVYRIPRGPERFQAYLRTMIDPDTHEMRMPLGAMDPLAKDHLPQLLDLLAELDAEGAGARATAEAAAALAEESGEYRVGLVVADDAEGGWTSRAAAELMHRRGDPALLMRGWITGLLWSSESHSAAGVREEVLTSIHRQAMIVRRGEARTLRELLVQEGNAMRMAGARNPVLEPHALVESRRILRPLLDHDDRPTLIAALFGDAAALALGLPPLGLPRRAGLAVALHGRLEPRRRRPSRGDPSHRPNS